MTSSMHDALVNACRSFLKPIARFLLRHGFTYKEFEETAKWAFVSVASDEYGIAGRKTNISRVAILTGLTRKEVRRIRQSNIELQSVEAQYGNRPSLVLSEWHSNSQYLSQSGGPKDIPIHGKNSSFEALCKRIVGDIPAGVVLKELERAGCVQKLSSGELRALSRTFMPYRSNVSAVNHFGASLTNLCVTLDYNLDRDRSAPAFLERTAWSRRLSLRRRRKLQNISQDYGTALLSHLDDWISANENDQENLDSHSLTGVGIYFFDVEEK